ncbi:hypothetical protein KK092_07265 [Curtobacterium flaccumfaciens pv. flaccumfaciens]|uniref:hypothetical protein n=1 Tax=Curtobacterium flaccumfaciens TaxID=2035 RepID=UPI001BDE31F5|nr:hypothetical protein [Curtobacterium flaccumfaciens]MBT1669176.1 hypothetical protein [Curtobacterium flaccumfaciens pv. flaccumfaciens]
MHDDAPPAAPAGWYLTSVGDVERYWDGESWIAERPARAPVEPDVGDPDQPAFQSSEAPAAAVLPTTEQRPTATSNIRKVGWHEHGWKRNTYRYWTGKTWLNPGDAGYDTVSDPKPVRKTPQALATGWWFVLIAVPVLALIIVMVTVGVNAPGTNTTTASSDDDTSFVADEPDLPSGFVDAGGGIAVKWLSDGDDGFTRGCQYSVGTCFKMQVYAYQSCPSSVYVAVNGLNSSDVVVGSSNDTLFALSEGETGALEFDFTEPGVVHAKFANASCY